MTVHLHYLAFGKNLLVPALWEPWPTAQMGTGQRAGNVSILWVLGSRLHSEAAPMFLNSKLKPKAVLVWRRM